MNYLEINKAILDGRDVDQAVVEKDDQFYKYLFNNKVAYYYSKYLSKNPNKKERWIIEKGEEINAQYVKTLSFLKEICDKNDISFLLYKTHKYIPEVVDGDIDIFVKKEDFHKFLRVIEGEGFKAVEDEPWKGKCVKKGYLIIEPHVSISWRNNVVLSPEYIWENPIGLDVDGIEVQNCSSAIELYGIVGELFFSPDYLDLLTIKKIAIFSIFELKELGDFGNLIKLAYARMNLNKHSGLKKKAPFFNSTFFVFFKLIGRVKFSEVIEICFKNIFWKYRYLIINKLPFTHDWKNYYFN